MGSFQLPDAFHDWVSENHVNWKTQKKDILAHCRRELMHAVWTRILDDDFACAMEYGIVVMCSDGVERRVYPRIFTYSADYPEKYVWLLRLHVRWTDTILQSVACNRSRSRALSMPTMHNTEDYIRQVGDQK
jgi:hypothetical protein